MRRSLMLFAMLLAAAPAHADVAADLARIESRQTACINKDSSNAGMVDCTDTARAAADKVLNRVYEAAVSRLKGNGEEDSKETMRRLIASERAWTPYRDAECSFEGTAMLGGSGEGLTIADCLYQKTAERAKAIGEVLDAK